MKLILIDDDCLVVSALKMILENEPDFEVAATAEDGSAAPALYREHRPDVLLIRGEPARRQPLRPGD